MRTKRIEEYFVKAQQIAPVLSLTEIQFLINTKGVTGPPKKSWWNLNNIIIMTTTTTLLVSILIGYFSTSNETNYQEPNPYHYEGHSIIIQEDSLFSNKIKSKKRIGGLHQEKELESGDNLNSGEKQIIEMETELLANQLTVEEFVDNATNDKYIEQVYGNESSIDTLYMTAINEVNYLAEPKLELKDVQKEWLNNGESKLITKSISTENINWFQLSNSRGDIDVETWEKALVEVVATVKMKGETDEDVKKGLEDFDLEIKKVGDRITVENNWEELNDGCMCVTYNWRGKKKVNPIKTSEGEKIQIEKVEIIYKVKVPQKMNMELKNSYADIKTGDINGTLKATLFKGDLTTGNIDGELELSEKYGNATVGSYEKGSATLFKAEAKMGRVEKLDIKINYSKVQLDGANNVNVDAFKSDLTIGGKVSTLNGSFKYGDFTIGEVGQTDLIIFKSKLVAQSFKEMVLTSSYTSVEVGAIEKLELKNAFKSDFNIDNLDKVQGELKYSPLIVRRLENSMKLNSFKGKIAIDNVSSNFETMDLKSKYTEVEFNFEENSKFELEAQTAYTDLSIPSGALSLSYQKQESYSSNLKGVFNSNLDKKASSVNVNCFQGSLSFQ